MRMVASKRVKMNVLKSNPDIAAHLPPSCQYSRSRLASMLHSHRKIVAKPVVGSGGKGIVFIGLHGNGRYFMKSGRQIRHFSSFSGLAAALDRVRKRRRYLLERWIPLAEINGRPVDYRIKFVRRGDAWELLAFVGRIAAPGLSTTNIARGGTLTRGRTAIRRSMPSVSSSAKRKEMIGLARQCTDLLLERFPGLSKLGLDFGLDRSGRIWIFEANTNPS